MTNHWTDIANADVILIMGSNAAENHPISFHWVTEAMNKGATLIHVDPRFTRTSAKAHIWAPIRSGTDIAFLGGMIKYIVDDIEKNPQNYNMEYLKEYTNASWLINPNYSFNDGIFNGYDAATRAYKDKSSWQYQLDENGIPKQDKTFKDPNCVFQLLKKHYARYQPDIVSRITGTPKEKLLIIYQTFASTGRPDKAGNIMYAMGTTQHTVGSQNVRAYTIIQLLLANVGIAGGGINALRGESNVQGATDHALLFQYLPGYLPVPSTAQPTLAKYLEAITPKTNDPRSGNWKQHQPKYAVSLLKAWYGDAATTDNEFSYQYLPKIQAGGNYSFIPLFEAIEKGTITGLCVWGTNPAVGGPNSNAIRQALEKLDWLVSADIWETETAAFWKRPGVDPKSIKTEVFLLPACASYEKEGSVTNSGRWAQWRYKAIDPPGEAEDDLRIVVQLMNKIRALYTSQGGPNSNAITKLTWDYNDYPDPNQVAKEINGYDLTTGKLVTNFVSLKDDGTTTSGNWLFSGSYNETGNLMARRDPKDNSSIGLFSNWAWSWPVNRRIIYNRASVDLNGNPFDPKRAVVKWDATAKKWTGDVIDGFGTKAPNEVYPFIMLPEGAARLFGMGMVDGPFPEHYEPWESPVKNMLSKTELNPAVKIFRPQEQGAPDKYPYVGTTYRVSEHWQAGAMTRNLPWLVELMPEMFIEIGEELAEEKHIRNGEQVIVESARGQVSGVAIVTKRLKPLQIDGQVVHEVGIPWHWGYMGLSTGDSGNLLTSYIGDANTTIPEYKAFLVNVRKAS
jgi:formate dehydrogenase major subunit